jgi:tocopherol cyclase
LFIIQYSSFTIAMVINRLKALFNPEQYHGWGRKKKYFEGWYFKVVNKAEDRAFAFIPGLAMDEKGEQQAFIQVLDGKKLTAEYHKFDARDFKAEAGKFELDIVGSRFSSDRIQLNLPFIKGEIRFNGTTNWPRKLYSPGIMGPYSFVPFMECYHGILSMDHSIEGILNINGEEIDFSRGRGYTEKDWGSSFPSSYIWLQTNHFGQPGTSLKASVAKIPWLGSSFTGFIAGLWFKNRLYRFTTYNGSHLVKSYANNEKVELILENRKYRIEIIVQRYNSTELTSPIAGFMEGRISESMTDLIEVRLLDKKTQKMIFQDTGRNGGVEVAGKVEEIQVGI